MDRRPPRVVTSSGVTRATPLDPPLPLWVNDGRAVRVALDASRDSRLGRRYSAQTTRGRVDCVIRTSGLLSDLSELSFAASRSHRTMLDSRRDDWRRSSRCVGESHCVEVSLRDQQILLRNSTEPSVILALSPGQWRDLLVSLKSGALQR
ncbi:DUF397 domain-containing protein [Actinoplanes sp. NPDC023714]|uniref:DUF397 domain-containing protein n=1 Tax=Actinoplanes sp. NPDC023714 TaxID=3154322 RepID=UPI0033EF0091